jgi:hypothetical protein
MTLAAAQRRGEELKDRAGVFDRMNRINRTSELRPQDPDIFFIFIQSSC